MAEKIPIMADRQFLTPDLEVAGVQGRTVTELAPDCPRHTLPDDPVASSRRTAPVQR
jgi:hypothetical protein